MMIHSWFIRFSSGVAWHASWLEVVYLLLATVGLVGAFLSWKTAKANYEHKKLKPGVRPLRVFMLMFALEATKIMLFIHVWVWLNALWAVSHAPPPPAPSQQSI